MADRIDGWWTLGEAPNYEVNDDGVVRHKPSGRTVQHHQKAPGMAEMVSLSAHGKVISRSVSKLVETGRKYQGAYDGESDRSMGEDYGGPDLRSEYRRKS